ncbi:MAG: amino acid ABC transporter permease [Protaetiibacter sp.]
MRANSPARVHGQPQLGDGDLDDVETIVAERRWHYGRGIAALAILVFIAWIVYQILTNDRFGWDVVGEYIVSPPILQGVLMTLFLTAVVMSTACVLGVVLATMRLSSNPILAGCAAVYVWFFRGVPALVQLVFWFNFAYLFPELEFGIPFGGPKLFGVPTNDVMVPLLAAFLGFTLIETAMMAEIIRGGILGVDIGQTEASRALGMRRSRLMLRVILPQAMRSIVPASGNNFISMLKWSSLATVVSVGELMHAAMSIYNRTFQVIPLLITASLWYLVLTTVLSIGQHYIEQYYGRGTTRSAPQKRWFPLGGRRR